jgi:RND family efflux transporter MFP subunit
MPDRIKASNMRFSFTALAASLVCFTFISCSRHETTVSASDTPAAAEEVTVGVVPASTREMAQHLTLSSELVPFQEIDVYAKEAGYVKNLYVDYGDHVKAGGLMAVLEIPELEAQLTQDDASIAAMADEVVREEHEVTRSKAQHDPLHQQYERLSSVAQTKPGLVAQQEVDDAQGKDLAAESQLEAVKGALQTAKSQLAMAKAKKVHDEALFSYSKIIAPFDGVVTQRYANLGALMQAGTTSTQATPLVRLSQEDLFRLVIPVPESYVKYIRTGDPVTVRVPALDRSLTGTVKRFSVDVAGSTRTMHTEVDVPNPNYKLVPGLYAEAVLTLNQKGNALVVPLQAVNHEGDQTTVYVVDPSNKLQDKKITLGILTANYAEVVSGLEKGAPVVVSDRSSLKAGQLVKAHQVQAMTYEGSSEDQ